MANLTIKIFLKYSWVFLFNIILILYSSELLLTIFLQPQVNSYIDLDYLRYQKAKELGADFDKRTYYQAFFEEKKNEPTLSPRYSFTKEYWSPNIFGSDNPIQNFMQSHMNNKNLMPLRGPINKKTLSCNEDGVRRVINNDKYGFKNRNSVYEKKIHVLLIGDSFTEGYCYDEDNDIAGVLRNKFGTNTANLGISGGGPLLSLASLKEYGTNFKPNFVVYLYSEPNDMEDLKNEKKTFLINYLDEFNQNLINRNDEINYFFNDYENIAYKFIEEIFRKSYNKFDAIEEEIKKSTSNKKIEILKDFFELQRIKNLFLTESFFNQNRNTIDKELFTRVLKKMKSETATWNGKFVVVYLPDWNRFNQKYSFVKFFHKKKIESIIKSLNISYIDIVQEFEKEEDPINFYPFGIRGHFTIGGYRLIAESIFKNIIK